VHVWGPPVHAWANDVGGELGGLLPVACSLPLATLDAGDVVAGGRSTGSISGLGVQPGEARPELEDSTSHRCPWQQYKRPVAAAPTASEEHEDEVFRAD
jgi:hypothetical protein